MKQIKGSIQLSFPVLIRMTRWHNCKKKEKDNAFLSRTITLLITRKRYAVCQQAKGDIFQNKAKK